MTRVKEQKQCGSCWAFATTGALEGQHFIKTGKLVELSEQQLVDCAKKDGCSGGWGYEAFEYIRNNGGINSEQSYPYNAQVNQCKFKKDQVAATDNGFVRIPEKDEQKLIEAIATIGPIGLSITVPEEFKSYKSGIMNAPNCKDERQHEVLAVGYDEKSFIIKNSWGPNWGENGYIRMARTGKNQCGIASLANYPKV